MALADLPLARFLDEAVVPYEMDEGDAARSRYARQTSLCPNRRHDRRGFSRFSFIRRRRGRIARPLAGHYAGNGGGGVETPCATGFDRVAKKISVVTRFRTTIGLPGSLRAYPAQSPRYLPHRRGHSRWIMYGAGCLCSDPIRLGYNQADAAAS